jgi:5'-nucleotidase
MPRSRQLAALGAAAATTAALVASSGLSAADARAATQGGRSGSEQVRAAQLPQAAAKPRAPRTPRVRLQILALNDFHGQLEPSTSSSSGAINGTPAGGAAYLATRLDQLRRTAAAQRRHSVTVAAGDLIGASPLVSAAFHDEPTIEAMNSMGLQVSSVGNHEFDEGWRELVRMQRGGCLPDGDGKDNQNSCAAHRFPGATFRYLSANVFRQDTGRTVFPAAVVRRYDGVQVGFIGMTLENTPNIVTRSGVEGLRFTDEVRTANAVAKRLDRQGVKSIVVLLHEGGFLRKPTAYDSCPGLSGAVLDINRGLSPRIDALVTGHTHQAYNCRLKDPDDDRRLVTSASSLGRLVTDIHLSIDRRTGEVVRSTEVAVNRIVTRDVPPNPAIGSLVSTYKTLVAPIENRVIGHLTGVTTVSRTADDSGESPLGNLIADAQRTDPSTVTGGRTPEVAFMNPGGIRADLTTAGGAVTYGSAFAVQPFNNYDVSMDLTGQQILTLLGQQWSGTNAAEPRILQVSGITYSYARSGTTYSLRPDTVKVGGVALDPARTYRVVANSFLADGGDGFAAFAEAQNKYIGGLDIDAFASFLGRNDPYTPAATDRITLVP